MSEIGRCHLGLHNGATKETLASEKVFVKEFKYDVLYVGRVYLVDYSVDRLAQHFPHVLLVLQRCLLLVFQIFHHLPQLKWGNVNTTRFSW
jgi:hypothetical protein